jgi:hypothetical protein
MGPPGATIGIFGQRSFAARAGRHLAPQPLSSGRNVFEELGTGYTLFAFSVDGQAVAAFEQAAKSHNIPLKVVRDTCEGGREAYEARLVLVRPDQYVVWQGDEPPQAPDALIKKVAGIA